MRDIQLSKQLQDKAKSDDLELLEEKERNVKEIVKEVTKKSKRGSNISKKNCDERKDEKVVCSDYVKMVREKKKRNKRKLQELGLVEKTPTPKGTTESKAASGTKCEKKTGARRKIMQSPKNRKNAKSKSPRKKVNKTCPFDHKLFDTNYCEENDKRYVGEEYDLHNVHCQGCKKCFSVDNKKNSVVPTLKEPLYVCRGRQKHQCTFSYCFSCYQSRFLKNSSTRRSRRRAD